MTCPFCAEPIRPGSPRCPLCGERLPAAPPAAPPAAREVEDVRRWPRARLLDALLRPEGLAPGLRDALVAERDRRLEVERAEGRWAALALVAVLALAIAWALAAARR